MRICTETARIVLSTFLIIAALAVSLSPLNIEYALAAWGIVALGAASSFLIWLLQAHHVPRFTSRVSYIALDLAILSQTASATAQALVAVSLPSPHLPLHNIPGTSILYLSLAGIFSFIYLWLVLQYEDAGRCWAALLGAGLFSSTLYLRSFAVAEAGPIYGPVFAMALAAIFTQHALRNTHYATGITQQALRNAQQGIRIVSHPAFWYMLFLLSVGLSVLFSPVPGQSLAYWLRLAVLMALSAILSRSVDTPRAWRIAAWGVFLIAGGIPILLSLSKLFSLVPLFGLPSALAYRLHPTELGGANLIARSVLCVLPLALALSSKPLTIPHNAQQATRFVLRASSFMSCAFVGGSAFVILYSQSWEGLFAWLMALGVYGILVYWERVLSLWRSFSSRLAKWGIAVATASLALCVVVSVRAALHLNIYSFNGRLTHWYGAVLAWLDHPWVGSGPGNEAAYAPYTEKVHLWVETQATLDDPLFGVDAEAGRFLRTHSHNLFLEVGSGSGVFSFFTFVGLLVTTFWLGLRTWRLSDGELRLWVAACLAGIVGELAWGSLDVLWVTPPFFSFPVWALIGLLFAAHRFSTSALYSIPPITRAKPFVYCSLSFVYLLLAFLLVLLPVPALASGHYAAGFTAFQERSWADASSQLERAAFYNPLDSHVHALLAWTYLERGYIEQAISAYERACMLKRGYSPYYSQLGWLVWLGGDVDRATYYFRQAIEQDSGELWREGLHADLGLVYAAQGRYEEAISMFKETIKLNPQMATAPYWRAVYPPPYQGERRVGELEIVLDPFYIRGPSPELHKRILAHLGASDVTPRLFAPGDMAGSPISLNDVLDTIEEDYREALAANSREAMLLLTVLAEASRAARLYSRAEQAYLEFQSLQPTSAYGFRELGVLYREQGRLAEAQAMLERAVMVSPRDFASSYNLALVYLDQGRLDEAEQVLNIITRQSLTTLFRSPLFDPDLYVAWARLYRARGDLVQAADAQRKISFIRGASADYLALADLYRQLGQPQQAAEQCTRAADALLRTWPRPLDPQLWEIGLCLAQSPVYNPQHVVRNAQYATRNVLLGHIYRARGQLEQALSAYQTAADAHPGEGAPHYFLGETYQALGQFELAEAEYRLAAQLDPLESLPLLALGRMQWSQGRRDAALATFRTAVEVTPGWGEAHTALGNALLALGDRQGAAEHYRLAQAVDGELHEHVVYDFVAHLAEAEVQSPGIDYVRNDYFTVSGERWRVLFAHPDSRITYTTRIERGGVLAFAVAMAPESWQLPGDGVAFAIYVESERGAEQVFSTYIDPKHNEADRGWHPHTVNLGAYAGRTVRIIFETSTGPAGDYRYDWAGWGEPRLLEP